MNCIECGFAQRGGSQCRSCVVRGQYMNAENRPLCCERCEYLTKEWECTLFRIENTDIRRQMAEKQR